MLALFLMTSLATAAPECPSKQLMESPDLDAWAAAIKARDREAWRLQWEMGFWQDWEELQQMGWTFPSSDNVDCGKPSTITSVDITKADLAAPGPPDYLVMMNWDLCGEGAEAQYHPVRGAILTPIAIGKWCRIPLFHTEAQDKDPAIPLARVELVNLTHAERQTLKVTTGETALFNRRTDGFTEKTIFYDVKGIELHELASFNTNWHGRTLSGSRAAYVGTIEIVGSELLYTKTGSCAEPAELNALVDPATCTGEPETTRYVKNNGVYVQVL